MPSTLANEELWKKIKMFKRSGWNDRVDDRAQASVRKVWSDLHGSDNLGLSLGGSRLATNRCEPKAWPKGSSKQKTVAWPPDWTPREASGDWNEKTHKTHGWRKHGLIGPKTKWPDGAVWDKYYKSWIPPEMKEIKRSKNWYNKFNKGGTQSIKHGWIVGNMENQLDHHQHMNYYRGGGAGATLDEKPLNEDGSATYRVGRPNHAGASWDEVDGWTNETLLEEHPDEPEPELDTSVKNIGYGQRPKGRKKNRSGGQWNSSLNTWMTVPGAPNASTHASSLRRQGSRRSDAFELSPAVRKAGRSKSATGWDPAKVAQAADERATHKSQVGSKQFDNSLARFHMGIKHDDHPTRTNLDKFLAKEAKVELFLQKHGKGALNKSLDPV